VTGFSETQKAFAGAVLDAEAATPAGLTRKADGAPSRRFGVYRNNVYAGLIDVLAGRFPVVARLVGEEFFRAMARDYVESEPPSSAGLLHYGASFAEFIAGFPQAATVPYLADVATLEWLRHSAYHAADAVPLPLQALASAADRAADARLALHPSLGVVRSSYPIVSIYELNVESGDVPQARLAGSEDALVTRSGLKVEIRRLAEGGAPFILALKEGRTIGEAAILALRESPAFDLKANLAGLMASGAIVAVSAATSD
jgi:Putative DNA-binding domain